MGHHRFLSACAIAFLTSLFAGTAHAADGRLEINQACAAAGCFPGDAAGFPVTIAASGSYLVTSNLQVTGIFDDGIVIQADNVILDLNGFTLVGPAEGTGTGVQLDANIVEIHNGTVRDFGSGIRPETIDEDANSSRLVDLQVTSNLGVGIRLSANATVLNCTVSGNGGSGINIRGGASLASQNTVRLNTKYGIAVGSGNSLIQTNIVTDNNQSAQSFTNIEACASCTLIDNHAP